jgi:hypothetical protein
MRKSFRPFGFKLPGGRCLIIIGTEGRGVGGRSLGSLAGDQVELGELFTFVSCSDQRRAAVELVDDLEDRLLPLLRRRPSSPQPADPQVVRGTRCFWDQRIGGFPHPVVDKPVGAVQTLNQLLTDGLPQRRLDLLRRGPENDRKHRDLGDVAETGKKLQRLLRFGREASELADHEVRDIIGVTLGTNPLQVPPPMRGAMIEGQQVLLGERVKKLNDEERVAGRLLVHKLRQQCGARRFAAKRIRY